MFKQTLKLSIYRAKQDGNHANTPPMAKKDQQNNLLHLKRVPKRSMYTVINNETVSCQL